MKKVIYLFFILSFWFVASQNDKDLNTLDEVNLKADKISLKTFKIDSIGSQSIQSNDGIILTTVLNRIPGVVMQQGALNTNRITIRGIGARSQFSTNRLKLYFGNVPLTNANGVSVLDDVDLNAIGHINIIKGPNSTQYGANLGGHMVLKAIEPSEDKVTFGASGGSFDRFQLNFGTVQNLGKTNIQAYANHIQSNEFRDNMAYDRQNLSLFSTTTFKENWSLKNMILGTRLKAFIPSSLSENDFLNNPENAARNWFASAGFESYEKILLASTVEYQFGSGLSWVSSLFFNHRDGYEPRPFDILDESETGYGIRTQLDYKTFVNDKPLNLSTGLEIQVDDYSAENFNNLYQNTPERESIQGDLVNAFQQNRFRLNAFAVADYRLSSKIDMSLGVNLNFAEYQTTDLFTEDGLNQSGELSYSPRVLPNLNIQYNISKGFDVFANYSVGIAVPGIDESLDEDGFFNTNLNTSFGHNYELGLIFSPTDSGLNLQINAFQMNVEDLIVARRVEEDRFVGINAGATRHLGFEFLLGYQKKISEDFLFDFNTNLALNQFEFTDFVDSGTDYTGNAIPAIPDYDAHLNIDLHYKDKWSVIFNSELIGVMPLDDANSGFTEAYQLFNLQLNHFNSYFNVNSRLSFGINNIFDIIYPASVLPNAVGFGGNPARFFYPGMPRQFYFRIMLDL